ncbi:MAG: GNAT family N-acetyltransferase [bacterium]
MEIVDATAEHLDGLAALNAEVQAIHVGFDPSRYLQPDLARLRAWFEELLGKAGSFVLVAVEGDRALGYAYFVIRDTPPNPFVFPQRSIYLDQLSVRDGHRGQGVGRALVDAVFARARALGASRVRLDTAHANHRAQTFFSGLGFRQGHLHWDAPVPAAGEDDL